MTARSPYWEAELTQLQAQHRYRSLPTATPLCSEDGFWLELPTGERLINASSNDYLAFSHHPTLRLAALEAGATYGIGMGSSRYIGGNSHLYAELEEAVARWKQTEAALVFPTGFQTNSSVLPALCGNHDFIIADRLNHASLVDGAKLSGATLYRYKHLDMNDLERRLQQVHQQRKPNSRLWIVSDSLFSMEGDYPDLCTLCNLADHYEAFTYLDEAHAGGVFGQQRYSGLAEALGVSQRITLHMGTFSKALGGLGGYVAGDKTLIQFLKNKARGAIYTTALPPSVLASNQAAVVLVQENNEAQRRLEQHIHTVTEALPPSHRPRQHSPIIPLYAGQEALALHWAEHCKQAYGVYLTAVRPPTVPVGKALLRLSLSSGLSDAQVQQIQACLKHVTASLEASFSSPS